VFDPNGIEVERLDRKDCIANFILRPNIIFYPNIKFGATKTGETPSFYTFARQLFAVDPIGSGVTESGGKVIFNQRKDCFVEKKRPLSEKVSCQKRCQECSKA